MDSGGEALDGCRVRSASRSRTLISTGCPEARSWASRARFVLAAGERRLEPHMETLGEMSSGAAGGMCTKLRFWFLSKSATRLRHKGDANWCKGYGETKRIE